jgi:predicted nucleic acid-binding protein
MDKSLATRFNRPAAYDAHYLALAEMMNCEFRTADRWLFNVVKDELAWVRWLGV